MARVVLLSNGRAAFLIMFSNRSPTPAGSSLSSVYLDQYSGDVLAAPQSSRTIGDIIVAGHPVASGGFAGARWQWLWFLLGLAPPLLFLSGVTMWWARASSGLDALLDALPLGQPK